MVVLGGGGCCLLARYPCSLRGWRLMGGPSLGLLTPNWARISTFRGEPWTRCSQLMVALVSVRGTHDQEMRGSTGLTSL